MEQDRGTGDDASGQERAASGVRHCPFCGELVGSFWGRTSADGAVWCESCQVFFEVRVR